MQTNTFSREIPPPTHTPANASCPLHIKSSWLISARLRLDWLRILTENAYWLEYYPLENKKSTPGDCRGAQWLRIRLDFPGGEVVKNPPANAGDTGSESRFAKIPHAAEQLSPCATATEHAL